MISALFVDRPRLAIVIAILMTLGGGLSLFWLPVSQFPDIVPPQVFVSTSYSGASAPAVEASIAQPLESAIVGVDKMIYMKSNSGNDGSYSLTVTFELGTNPDINTVNVNNRVQQALAKLPEEVRATLETRTATGTERARQYPVSALTGEGVDRLLNAIADLLGAAGEAREVSVPLADGATIAWLYRHGEVRSRRDEGDTAWLTVALDAAAAAQFERRQMAR